MRIIITGHTGCIGTIIEKNARMLPEFKPQWDVRKGAEQPYAAYLKSRVAREELEGPRYRRIAHIGKPMSEGILGPGLHLASETAAPRPGVPAAG